MDRDQMAAVKEYVLNGPSLDYLMLRLKERSAELRADALRMQRMADRRHRQAVLRLAAVTPPGCFE